MFLKIVDIANLKKAFVKLKRNITETPFYRDISVNFYERHLEFNLLALQKKLLDRTYKTGNLCVYKINKPDGDVRYLYKHYFEDCIIEIAILNILGPLFEEKMDNCSFGNRLELGENPNNYIYKPYWNQYQKFEENKLNSINEFSENHNVIRSDIKQFFDKINVDILLNYLRENGISGEVIDLIEKLIETSTESGNKKIVAQGTFLAPFLANIYLISFDNYIKEKSICDYFRYVDDFLIILNEDQDENDFFFDIKDYLQNSLFLDLHSPTKDIKSEDFSKSFIGSLVEDVKEQFNIEAKKQIYGETRLVESLIRSRDIDSSLFLQTLLLYTGQKEESAITEKDIINYTQRFLIFWRNTFPELSTNLEIERIACKILDLNQIPNINRIRLFFSIMLEVNNGNFSLFLKRLLKSQISIIRDAFLSTLPLFISDEKFKCDLGTIEILEHYLLDKNITDFTKKQLTQIVLQIEDDNLINKLVNSRFLVFLINGFQTSLKIDIIPREGRNFISCNQLIESFNSKYPRLVLEAYKFINYLGYTKDFFNYCSQQRVIQIITSNQELIPLFVRLLIYCDGLREFPSNFNRFLNSNDSFTIKLVENILEDLLNFTYAQNLGLTPYNYYHILFSCNTFFTNWDLRVDLKNKLITKVGSYIAHLGNFANFPFATSFPHIHFLTVNPSIVKEVRSGFTNISDLFNNITDISDFSSSKTFIKKCFGNFSMITNIPEINESKKEYIIEYQIPEGFIPLSDIIKNQDTQILQIIKSLFYQLKEFKEKIKLPLYFLNIHNIFINPKSNEIKFFGFFPNLETSICKYIPNREEIILFPHNNKSDFTCLGYLLFDIYSSEKISTLSFERSSKKKNEIKNPYLTYIIKDKLLSEDYDRNYSSYEILEKDINYSIKKWKIYNEDPDKYYKILDFTIFKIIKKIFVIRNPKNKFFLFEQGKELFDYFKRSDLAKFFARKMSQNLKIKDLQFKKIEKNLSPFGKYIINFIQFSREELNTCQNIRDNEKKQCKFNSESIFYFLLLFTEFERYFTHLTNFILVKIRDEIDPNLKYTLKSDLNDSKLSDITSIMFGMISSVSSNDIIDQFDNFDSFLNFFKFFSTKEIILSPEINENLEVIIKPPLEKILKWDSQVENKLKEIQKIYDNITQIPFNHETFQKNKGIILKILNWLFDSKLSLKIYNEEIENLEKFFDKYRIFPVEITYRVFFRKKKKPIYPPFIIPIESIYSKEKRVFPIEFVRRKFKSKLPSFIFPIQYESRWQRIKSNLKVHKYNLLIVTIEFIICLFAIFDINRINNLLLYIISGLLLPVLEKFIENFTKKS